MEQNEEGTDQRTWRFYLSPKWCFMGLMVYFVMALFGWAYYVFVFLNWGPKISETPGSAIPMLILFHIFLILTVLSYIRTVFTDPGSVPHGLPESPDAEQRHCTKCQKNKPERSHHCSICKRCVLKMDHHCPWVNNCVGWRNYKFFLLFLFWTTVLCLFIVFSSIPIWMDITFKNLDTIDLQRVIIGFIAIAFGLGLLCFCYSHIHLTLGNMTTIEYYEKARMPGWRNTYDVGQQRNFQQVFGYNPWMWLMPVRTSVGNGLVYPRNDTTGGTDVENPSEPLLH